MKLKINSTNFYNYKYCLINALYSKKIKSNQNVSTESLINSVNEIASSEEMAQFISSYFDEKTIKRIRNAVYQRKYYAQSKTKDIRVTEQSHAKLIELANAKKLNMNGLMTYFIDLHEKGGKDVAQQNLLGVNSLCLNQLRQCSELRNEGVVE